MTTQANNANKHVYILTNFSQNDPDRTATPLVLANCALSANADVVLWLTMEGVELARKGAAESLPSKSFAPVGELLESYIENGGRIGVCPPCAKSHDLTEEEFVGNAEWIGGAALLELAADRQCFSF